MGPVAGHYLGHILSQVIRTHQSIRTLGDGNGALGVLAHSQAGNVQVGGFFLQAAGVSDDDC